MLDPTVVIKSVRFTDRNLRRPVAGSLGVHLKGVACPHPDLTDTQTTLEGALYRFCPKIPGYGKKWDRVRFRNFVQRFCERKLTPLSLDCDRSVPTWLQKTPYTLKRKAELQRKNDNIIDKFAVAYQRCKSFVKDEFYPEYKHARAINSRSDEFKTLVGPIMQLISDEVFKLPYFIKKIPVADRPEELMKLYREGGWVLINDFSSFEAHFTREVMQDTSFVLYDYMTKNLPEHDEFMLLMDTVIGGINHIEFKNILLDVEAKRMSGEMDTSLANGFSNLMFLLFICEEVMGLENVDTRIEGDDSLTAGFGVPPDNQIFKDFGLRSKVETCYELNTASFCGMIFDVDERKNVTDPREVLSTFGWTSFKYIRSRDSLKKSLVRCKALSLAYQYPSCPILSVFAQRMLYLTKSHNVKGFIEKQGTNFLNLYKLDILKQAVDSFDKMRDKSGNWVFSEPGPKTRLLVENMYGIKVTDQLAIEDYIRTMRFEPIDCPLIRSLMPDVWCDYYERYHGQVRGNSVNFEYPTELWPQVRKNLDTGGLTILRRLGMA